jgi:hypothetical protein
MAELFPAADPRPFLSEQVASLYDQAESINPGGAHPVPDRFHELCDGFLEGEIMAETVCLYAMTTYLGNPDTLTGTKAGWELSTFAETFGKYVPLPEERRRELWEDAQHMVEVEGPRLKAVSEYMDGSRTFPYPMLAVKAGPLDSDLFRWYLPWQRNQSSEDD